MKAAIYLRQSKGDDEGIERQRARCTKLAEAREWIVAKEFVDNDVSASQTRGQATAWAKMLDGVAAGEFDVIIATRLDRILRRVQDLGVLIDLDAKVVTVDGDIDLTSAFGEFQATLAAGLARFEVRRKSERQRDANAKRASEGKWVGGRRPFGFEADGVTVREHEADAIRRAYNDVVTGLSLAAVARNWNAAGFTTGQTRQARSGHAGEPSPWRASTVRRLLLNPRYAGRVRYKGEVQATPAVWPAIVEASTWEAVNAILTNPMRATPGRAPTYLLTGIARCGVAGCGATVHAGGNARRGVPGYRCSGSLGHFARMAEPIDDYVSQVIVARLSRPDARNLLHKPQTVDTGALTLEAAGLRARMDALAVDFADGALTGSQLRAATTRMRERLATIEAELADAGRVDVLGDLVDTADVHAAWEGLVQDRRREVLRTLADVTIHPVGRGTRTFRPESVTITWLSDDT